MVSAEGAALGEKRLATLYICIYLKPMRQLDYYLWLTTTVDALLRKD